MKKKVKKSELGLLLIYGARLPPAGVVFLVPVKRDMLTKVKEAMLFCNNLYPHPNSKNKYEGIWADGSLSLCNENKDRERALLTTQWDGFRYEWSYSENKFIPLVLKYEIVLDIN
jgi:hypothetical protein